jgi:transcription elongation factor GreA
LVQEEQQTFTLVQAIGLYLSQAKTKGKDPATHLELQRFAQWYGTDKMFHQIAPSDIGDYSERTAAGGASPNAAERLQVVRNFLSHMKKKGYLEHNLAQHVRIRKTKSRIGQGGEHIARERGEILTSEGHAQLLKELARLKIESESISEDIHKAAQDKDVRENAPLEAAREQKGHVEGRINQLESQLRNARIIDSKKMKKDSIVRVGSKVVVKDPETGKRQNYTLVSAAEANPLEGRISDVSPVGKAIFRKHAGQEVQVETPRGTQQILIVKVSS